MHDAGYVKVHIKHAAGRASIESKRVSTTPAQVVCLSCASDRHVSIIPSIRIISLMHADAGLPYYVCVDNVYFLAMSMFRAEAL